MSIENNKQDFEEAIEALNSYLGDLGDLLNPNVYNAIEGVINEYCGHFKSDIEDLQDELEEIKGKLNENNS